MGSRRYSLADPHGPMAFARAMAGESRRGRREVRSKLNHDCMRWGDAAEGEDSATANHSRSLSSIAAHVAPRASPSAGRPELRKHATPRCMGLAISGRAAGFA
jgi:hypothetical protein